MCSAILHQAQLRARLFWRSAPPHRVVSDTPENFWAGLWCILQIGTLEKSLGRRCPLFMAARRKRHSAHTVKQKFDRLGAEHDLTSE
jgi:hypothetical protein